MIYAACTRSLTSPKTHRRERMSSRELEIDFGWVSTTRMSTHVVEVELAILLGCEMTIPYRHIMFVVYKQTMRRMRGKVKSPTHQKSMPCQTEFAVSSSILHKPEKWALNTHPNSKRETWKNFMLNRLNWKRRRVFYFLFCLFIANFFSGLQSILLLLHITISMASSHSCDAVCTGQKSDLTFNSFDDSSPHTHPSEEYQIPSPPPPPLSFGACCGFVQKYNKTRNL